MSVAAARFCPEGVLYSGETQSCGISPRHLAGGSLESYCTVCWQVNMLDLCRMEWSMRMNSRRDRFPFRLVDHKQVCNEDGHYFPTSCGRAPYPPWGFVHLYSPAVIGNIRFLNVCLFCKMIQFMFPVVYMNCALSASIEQRINC